MASCDTPPFHEYASRRETQPRLPEVVPSPLMELHSPRIARPVEDLQQPPKMVVRSPEIVVSASSPVYRPPPIPVSDVPEILHHIPYGQPGSPVRLDASPVPKTHENMVIGGKGVIYRGPANIQGLVYRGEGSSIRDTDITGAVVIEGSLTFSRCVIEPETMTVTGTVTFDNCDILLRSPITGGNVIMRGSNVKVAGDCLFDSEESIHRKYKIYRCCLESESSSDFTMVKGNVAETDIYQNTITATTKGDNSTFKFTSNDSDEKYSLSQNMVTLYPPEKWSYTSLPHDNYIKGLVSVPKPTVQPGEVQLKPSDVGVVNIGGSRVVRLPPAPKVNGFIDLKLSTPVKLITASGGVMTVNTVGAVRIAPHPRSDTWVILR